MLYLNKITIEILSNKKIEEKQLDELRLDLEAMAGDTIEERDENIHVLTHTKNTCNQVISTVGAKVHLKGWNYDFNDYDCNNAWWNLVYNQQS